MKKLMSLALALMMLLSFGCMSALAEEPVTITFTMWGDAAEQEVTLAAIESFKEETGIIVEMLYVPHGEYVTKLNTMAAANELPDCGYMMEANTVEWANKGMLLDMTEMLNREDNAAKLESNKYYDKNGNVCSVSAANEAMIMYYNPVYFDQMGIAYPPSKGEDAWTWDEFVDVCRQLTVDVNGKHPGEDGFDPENIRTYGVKMGKSSFLYEALMRSNGGGIYTEDYSDIALDSPESLEVLQALADLINVHHVSPSPAAAANSMDIASCFLSNSVAMIVDGQWSLMSLAIAAEEEGISYDVAVLPKFKEPVTGNTGTGPVVFATTEHPEEALAWANYITTTENVMPFIKNGLWQPVIEEWYMDEELIDQWITEGVHPEHYREAVIDYSLKYIKPTSWFKIGCYAQIENLFLPALDPAIIGDLTAEECIATVIDECRNVYSEYLASIS